LIKVIIADDHPVVLHGLVTLLSGEPDFRVIAACEDGARALEAIFKHAPDIALIDLRLPKMSGLQVLEKASKQIQSTRIVILTAFSDDRDVLLAISRGVHGILMKDSVANTLIQNLRRVNSGDRCIPAGLIAMELERQAEAVSVGQSLTSRERDVLRLIAQGQSNKRVAEQLQICEGTLKLHLHHIYEKTGLRNRSELMKLGLRIGDVLEQQLTRQNSVSS